MSITKALETCWTVTRDKTLGKSADQLRRWRNPRMKAVRNFVDVVGDKALDQITRDDMLDFRNWWLERIEDGEVGANSANKDLIHLADVLKTVVTQKRLGMSLPLGDLSFKEGPPDSPTPFSDAWIADKILSPGALDGRNAEARAILLGIINTGCRPSEVAALTVSNIRLDCDVPHICIRPDGRQIKSAYAKRDIPLTGISLEALRAFPEGFPRYRESSASLIQRVMPELIGLGRIMVINDEAHDCYRAKTSRRGWEADRRRPQGGRGKPRSGPALDFRDRGGQAQTRSASRL